MGVENFLNYESYIQLQNKQLEIWGQNCTIFVPENITNLGYENVTRSETDKMDADSILSNQYRKQTGRIWINFKIEKKVFYKFNYFPEDGEELVVAFMDSSVQIRENSYIRTTVPGTTSIWGDLIFEVVHIQDIGLAQVLQRVYFLKATNNQELYRTLSVGDVGEITGSSIGSEVIKPIPVPTPVPSIESYDDLKNKPSINDVVLEGNKTTEELNIDVVDKYTDSGTTETIGGINKGDTFEDTPISDVMHKLLHPYVAPKLTSEIYPSVLLNTQATDSVIIIVDFEGGSSEAKKCEIFVHNQVIYSDTTLSGHIDFTYRPDELIIDDTIFTIILTDFEGKETIITKTLKFIEPSYCGTIEDEVEIDSESIKQLSQTPLLNNNYVTPKLSSEYGRIVFAYPVSFGEVEAINDYRTNFDLFDSFEFSYIQIDDKEYIVYSLKESAGYDNVQIVFKGKL